MVKVGNSECEFLKLTPLSRSSAMAGAVCGVTILPRKPSGIKRIKLRGVAFCAEARPVVESVIRLADSNVMARRIWFLPLSAIQLEADVRFVLCRDSIVTTGREPDRRRRNAFPRYDLARVLQSHVPLLPKRAQGKPGADCARSPVCESRAKKAHGLNHRYSRDIPAFPAQWFYGLFRALPGERRLLPPSPAGNFPASLTPRSRRQDHTASPSAANVSSGGFVWK